MISVGQLSTRMKVRGLRHETSRAQGDGGKLVVFAWPSAATVSVLCRVAILAILVLGFITGRVVIA